MAQIGSNPAIDQSATSATPAIPQPPVAGAPVSPPPVVAEPVEEPTFFDIWSASVDTFEAARQAVRDAQKAVAAAEREKEEANKRHMESLVGLDNSETRLEEAESQSEIAARHLHGVLSEYLEREKAS